MVIEENGELWIHLEETVAAHHEEVFACLTTSGGLTRWFSVAAQVDLRQGGTITFGWDEKFRSKTTIAILDFDAGGLIVWDWQAQRSDMHAPIYWRVEPAVEDGSRLEFRQGPFKREVESLIALADEVDSWRWYLCNLRVALEARHDMRRVRPL